MNELPDESPPASLLRATHDGLASGPLCTKWALASASPVSKGSRCWVVKQAVTDVKRGTASGQSQVFDPVARQLVAAIPDAEADVARSPAHSLELRQTKDDKALYAEVWDSATGARLARTPVAGVGSKVLQGAHFGRPQFSPSGARVVWAAERLPEGAESPGYWSRDAKKNAEKQKAADAAGAVRPGKFALSDARCTGEALLVHNSLLVAWDWATGVLEVVAVEKRLPEHELKPGEVAVAAHPTWDGTDEGIIFGCYRLPPRMPGLSFCINRPTSLYHLRLELVPPQEQEAAAAAAAEGAAEGAAEAEAAEAAAACCLTPDLFLANFPRLSPDGRWLAFAARAEPFGVHNTCLEVRLIDWAAAGAGLTGKQEDLSSLTWLSETSIIFTSIAYARRAAFTVDVRTLDLSSGSGAAVVRRVPPGEECAEMTTRSRFT